MTLYSFPPLLSLFCFISLALLTILRGARTRLNHLFFMLCILAGFICSNYVFSSLTRSGTHALWASRIEHLFIPLLLPLYIAFFQEYLNITGRKWLLRFAFGYAGLLICLAPTDLYITHMVKYPFGFIASAGPFYFLFALGEAVTTIYILILVCKAIGREKTGVQKNRLKYVLLGFGSLGFLNGLNFLTILGLVVVYPPGNFSFIPLAIFAVGLFKHDLLDMGILIKKSLIYSCLTALLTCLYAVIVIVANHLFSGFILSDSLLIPVGFFLLITFIFGPIKSGIQHLVDKLFFKRKYDYQAALKDLSRQIVSELDTGAIGKQLLSVAQNAMRVEHCALFIRQPSQKGDVAYHNAALSQPAGRRITFSARDNMVLLFKNQNRPISSETFLLEINKQNLSSTAAQQAVKGIVWGFPLLFKENLNGFLLLGEKRSGDLYTREDLDLLETLCSQSALALENALSYRQIDRLNNQLEKKVADRTKELRAALKEKEETQEQLIRSESLASIGQLVAGVAHELNNPLTTAISLVQSTVEDMKEFPGEPLDETTAEDLAFVEKELGRAKAIVRSLLGLSRQTDTYKEKVNLNAVIKDACRILHNQYKHTDLNIKTVFSAGLPDILGNFATLGQVALNILQNAIQAVPGNRESRIVLSTRYEIEACEVVFECSDTGPGIPESIQKDIFKPFFTTKEVGQGTGLGLYLSHEIVRKHGGNLSFESVINQGSRFMVRLPAAVPLN